MLTTLTRLLPAPVADVATVDAVADVPEVAGRPAVRVVMVQSLDGAIAVDGRSGPLGGDADRAVYLANRAAADVVLVGAATVRAEGYGPARLTPQLTARRAAAGMADRPPIAVVSRSLDLDPEAPFFRAARSRPIVVTVAAADRARRDRLADVADIVVAGDRDLDAADALAQFGARGARLVVCEGGPALNGTLWSAGLVDELFLSVAPVVTGGRGPGLVDATDGLPDRLALRAAYTRDDFLFLQLRRAGGA